MKKIFAIALLGACMLGSAAPAALAFPATMEVRNDDTKDIKDKSRKRRAAKKAAAAAEASGTKDTKSCCAKKDEVKSCHKPADAPVQ